MATKATRAGRLRCARVSANCADVFRSTNNERKHQTMRCPFCGHDDTQVKDSRPSEDNSAIRRRRHCLECGGRFTTFERVQLRELVVLKKNSRREPFEREKLERSMNHAMRKRP